MKLKPFTILGIFLLLIFKANTVASQCGGFITLDSQESIDNFNITITGDDCLDFDGSISIIGPDITNLNGLSLLNSISGSLNIYDNAALTNLDGLDGLISVGSALNIYHNPMLNNIDGLSQLTSIGFLNTIESNPLLTTLSGLNNLESIGGPCIIISNDLLTDIGLSSLTSTNGMSITLNNSLQQINSLSSMTDVNGFLGIDRNNSLTSLSGLDNIDPNTILNSEDPRIIIEDNPMLGYCAIQFICDAIEMSDIESTIENNANGCFSVNEVSTECSGPIDPADPIDPDGLIYYSLGIQSFSEKGVFSFDEETGTTNHLVYSSSDNTRHSAFCLNNINSRIISQSGVFSKTGKYDGPSPHNFYGNPDLEFDNTTGDLYYCRLQNIYRNSEELFNGVSEIRSIALDETNGLIYYTDISGQMINVYDINTSESVLVYQSPSGLTDIRAIEIDPTGQSIYYTDFGKGKIEKLSLDDGLVETAVDNIERPINLVYNVQNDIIYWTQEEEKKLFYFENGEVASSDLTADPQNLEVDTDGFIYWSSVGGYTIEVFNPNSKKSDGVLVAMWGGDFSIAIDAINQKMAVARGSQVSMSELDGTKLKAINRGSLPMYGVKDVALNPLTERVYYFGVYEPGVSGALSSKYDGTDIKILNPDDYFWYISGFFVDIYEEKLYYKNDDGLNKSNLDGTEKELISDEIRTYSIDKVNERIYYQNGDFISYADLSGNNEIDIISGDASVIEVDPENDRLYFLEDGVLKYTDLEGMFETQLINLGDDNIFSFSLSNSNGVSLLPIINTVAFIDESSINLEWEMDADFTGLKLASVATGNFYIQKKTLFQDWYDVGTVPYFENVVDYSFVDNDAETGPNTYRIKYISDEMSLSSFSKTFTVDFVTSTETVLGSNVKVWNTPNNNLNVEGFKGKMNIFGSSGELVQSAREVNSSISVSLEHLPIGVYFVRLEALNGLVKVVPIVIN